MVLRHFLILTLLLSLSWPAWAGDIPVTPDPHDSLSDTDQSLPVSVAYHTLDRKKLFQLKSKGRSILNLLKRRDAPRLPEREADGLSAEEQDAYTRKIQEWMAESSEPLDIVLNVRRRGKRIDRTVVGIQKGLTVYIPMIELANIIRFQIGADFETGTASGYAGHQDNTFSVDTAANTYSIRGQVFSAPPDSFIVQDFGQGLGDIYATIDLLNALWSLRLNLVYEDLALLIETPQLLPIERDQQRLERQEGFLASLEDTDITDNPDFTFIPNDYKAVSKPAVNLSHQTSWDDSNSRFSQTYGVRGVNDLLWTAADYNAQVRYDNEDGYDLRNLRLRMKRRADVGNELPLGLKSVEGGDISTKAPNLIDRNITGTGISFSNKPFRHPQSFDQITVEGTGEPGWEVEVYNGNQLENFGVIDARGEYRFEGIQLSYGKNEIKTILYGPQGEVEERVKEYNIANALLPRGETVVEGAVLDYNQNLIEVEDHNALSNDGYFHTASVQTGFNDWLTPFVTSTSSNTEKGRKNYLSAGANFAALGGLGLVEGYKDLGGGSALDTRFSSKFSGIKYNLRSSLFHDFESEVANYDTRAKTSEHEARADTSYLSDLGNIGLSLGARHTTFEDDTHFTDLNYDQSLSYPGLRFSNRMRSRLDQDGHDSTSGRLGAFSRFSDNWTLRSVLNYKLFPDTVFNTARLEARYSDRDKFTGSFDVIQDLEDSNTKFGADASYDFGYLRSGLGLNWDLEDGFDATFRTSMSLGPFGEDGAYIMSSKNLTSTTALQGRVFRDIDMDGVYSEGDEPLEGAKLLVNKIETDPADSEGRIYKIGAGGIGLTNVALDSASLNDSLLVSSDDGYVTVLRPVTAPVVDIPVVTSGAIDGNVYFADGRPSPTLRVQLVDANGRVAQETVADFEGYYNFDHVRPGKYTLRADPSHNLDVTSVTLAVLQDDPFVQGVDLQIAATPETKDGKAGLGHSLRRIINLVRKKRAATI